MQAEDQPAAGEQAGAEEVAAADVDDLAHFATPFAASAAAAWIALRIRGYVPQRQMLPAHGVVDIGVGGLRVLAQQHGGGHDLTRLAIAALRHVRLDPGLL